MRLAAVQHDVEGRKPAPSLQHSADLAVEPCPVRDVHRHMLQQHDVETAVVEWQLQRTGGLERHPPPFSRAPGQIARGIHQLLPKVDAPNPAALRPPHTTRPPPPPPPPHP